MPENVSGFAVDDALIDDFGVYVELPAFRALVFTLASGDEEVDALVDALEVVVTREIANAAGNPPRVQLVTEIWPPVFGDVCGISQRDAFFAPAEIVPAERAAGRVSADTLCPYPPDIPVVAPSAALTGTGEEELSRKA